MNQKYPYNTMLTAMLIATGINTGIAIMQTAGTPPADPFRDAVKDLHFGGSSGLKATGAMKTGVKLDGGARAQAGDGLLANFDGGWLAACEETNRKPDAIDNYGFSLHVCL